MLYEGLNSKQITAKSARYTEAAARFGTVIVSRCGIPLTYTEAPLPRVVPDGSPVASGPVILMPDK